MAVSPSAYKRVQTQYKRIQKKIHSLLEENLWIISGIGILIFLNLFLFVLENDAYIINQYESWIILLEFVSIVVFTVEYIARVWVCVIDEKFMHPIKGRLRYLVTPLALLDLLGLIHFYLPAIIPLNFMIFRVFRLLRLTHVVGLEREKETFYEIFEGVGKTKFHRGFALFLTILIVLNIVSVALEFDVKLYKQYYLEFLMFEYFSLFFFTIEYILRVWVIDLNPKYADPIKGRLKYMITPLALIDLLTILPFYLPIFIPFEIRVLRVFRLFRLFRVLKLGHYANEKALEKSGD